MTMNAKFKNNALLLFLVLVALPQAWAQDKTTKIKERFNVNDDVNINLDVQNTDIVFEDWNKDEVEIEAYLETDGLSDDEIARLKDNWRMNVQGNSNMIRINSVAQSGGIAFGAMPMGGMDEIIRSSMSIMQPVMKNMVGPLLEGFAGKPLPQEYYKGMSDIKFDYDAYKRDGEKYIKEYNRKVEENFGKDFDDAMKEWGKENSQLMKNWESQMGKNMGLPESPFGTTRNLDFDPDTYGKDKKAYVAKLNKKYGSSASVKDVDKWLVEMEAWGDDLGKGMEAWGNQFAKQFGGRMESMGETFGKQMEKDMEAWGENFGKRMEAWGENFGKQMEQWAKENEGNFEQRVERDENGNVRTIMSFSSGNMPTNSRTSAKGSRKIIIRKPKTAKLDLNVRHGEVNLGDANNARVNLSHGGFTAKTINGDQTLLTVSYSPVKVDRWNSGSMRSSYVKDCVIDKVEKINLDSRASNVIINELGDSAIISGTFGELSIPKVSNGFNSLNINLENSDLALRLPDAAFHFTYTGTRSNLNYPKKLDAKVMESYDSKMVNGFNKSRNTDSSISISAKFSDVVVN
mgnify:CR=1 FL=1